MSPKAAKHWRVLPIARHQFINYSFKEISAAIDVLLILQSFTMLAKGERVPY
jgi:hypothetical protein